VQYARSLGGKMTKKELAFLFFVAVLFAFSCKHDSMEKIVKQNTRLKQELKKCCPKQYATLIKKFDGKKVKKSKKTPNKLDTLLKKIKGRLAKKKGDLSKLNLDTNQKSRSKSKLWILNFKSEKVLTGITSPVYGISSSNTAFVVVVDTLLVFYTSSPSFRKTRPIFTLELPKEMRHVAFAIKIKLAKDKSSLVLYRIDRNMVYFWSLANPRKWKVIETDGPVIQNVLYINDSKSIVILREAREEINALAYTFATNTQIDYGVIPTTSSKCHFRSSEWFWYQDESGRIIEKRKSKKNQVFKKKFEEHDITFMRKNNKVFAVFTPSLFDSWKYMYIYKVFPQKMKTATIKLRKYKIKGMDISPDGKHIAIAFEDNTVSVYTTKGKLVLQNFQTSIRIQGLSFISNTNIAVTSYR